MKTKQLFLFVALLVSSITFSQDYIMGTAGTGVGLQTTCSGTFYDSGGPTSLYGTDEDHTITFCPDLVTNPGSVIQIEFTSFNTQNDAAGGACIDQLQVWHANNNTGIVSTVLCGDMGASGSDEVPFTIQSVSPDGCITFQFTSNDTSQKIGWIGNISCFVPCTPPVANLVDDSTIDICAPTANPAGNTTVSFDASPSTTEAGTNITFYDWVWGDGTIETSTTPNMTHNYPGVGIYQMSFVVRNSNTADSADGCVSTPLIKLIRILPEPNFTGTTATESGANTPGTTITIDCGDTVDLIGLVASQTETQNPPSLNGGVTQLPDISSSTNPVSYESELNFTGLFPAGSVITPGCYPTLNFDIEHTYSGDLIIELIAPSGQSVVVYDRHGFTTNFGNCANPNDPGSVTDDHDPGCTAHYVVVATGGADWTAGTSTVNGAPGADGAGNGQCAEYTLNCQGGDYYVIQTYTSTNPFTAFDGADMNGIWKFKLTDTLPTDNGVLTSWGIDFPGACYGSVETVTPDLVVSATSGLWEHTGTGPTLPGQNPTSIVIANPGPDGCPSGATCEGTEITNNITVGPFDVGGQTYTYTFLVTDEFGCQYEQDIIINVSDNCTECTLDLDSAAGTDAQNICEGDSITDITYLAGNEVVDVVVDAGLPAGVTGSYNAATSIFTITGTPSVTGTFNYTVTTVGCLNADVATQQGTIIITELPTATIVYGATPYCTSITTQEAVTLNGTAAFTGGTYSSAAGLTLDANTGDITPNTSIAGTYTVTYTIAAAGGCPQVTATTTVDVTEVPTAVIAYANTPFCNSITTAEVVTLNGTAAFTGGTYSSTVDLTIDVNTGAITPSTSIAGTYTVTYTIPASAGCAAVPVTTTVVITELPTATIVYGATPYCTSITTAEAVTLTGTAAFTGGTYSSTAGLTLDTNTGAITPSTSTAGTYTVTYNTLASGGCSVVPATTTVVITELPTAIISYVNTPFCDTITTAEAVTLTGTASFTGGVYSSTAGLTLDVNTGAIIPSTSTAGTYVVTYTVPASAGCAAVPATTTVVVTELPTAAIVYGATPYCTSITTAEAVTLTGTATFTGGTYSSTAGLTLDTNTGAITPSTSTAGTYTVTYNTPISGGCAAVPATTTVVITELPTAIISYDNTPFCDTITTAEAVTLTGTAAFTGGVYSSTAGLTLDVNTGAIIPSTSTAGTYTVTYTVPASSGCAAVPATTTVVVTELPTAAIVYGATPYCTSITTAEAVTLTGTAAFTGGTYSSTAGLTLDTNTGAITPSTSTAGTYTVTYNTPISGGCAAVPATTTVVITELPTAIISYDNTPFCDTITTAEAVTLTGTAAFTGGLYSSTVGLTIDMNTGAIIPSTSTAGTYTVTYTVPASAGCAAVPATTTVVVTELPTAAIVYGATPYCTSITTAEAVTLTGTAAFTGGTYSSTAGLTLDTNTGAITPSTSTAGTYTVTYNTPISGGCAAVPATTTVVITELPTAIISYDNTPFCDTITTAEAVTLTGTAAFTGGLYSSTVGLTIDMNTGAIIPSTSTAGTYTVTYTVPASAGCAVVPATTTVVITELPTAAIVYGATPYCTSITTAEAVTLTGTVAFTGGTYSSTAGLTLDTSTGAITPSTSTAGTYTVTYNTPISGGCAAVPATTTVVITELPTAAISYVNSPFCVSTTSGLVTITGTGAFTGGVYSSTAGLTLDVNSGEVNPSTSTAGIYTVTYMAPAIAGCVPEPAIAEVVINPLPTLPTNPAAFLYKECDTDVIDGLATFDEFGNQTDLIIGTNNYVVTYHLTLGDAIGNTGIITDGYVNTTPTLQVIGVRIEDPITGCINTMELTLEVVAAPQAFPFENPITYCDTDNDSFGYFDLTSIVADLTGGIVGIDVEFYETEAEADLGVGAIDTSVLYENVDTDGDGIGATQTIYAQLSGAALNCYTLVEVNLLVINSPVLPSELLIYAECETIDDPDTIPFNESLDGIIVFDLTSYEETVLYTEIINAAGGDVTVTNQYTATYYTELNASGNVELTSIINTPNAYENETTPDQIIYVVVTHTGDGTVAGTGCSIQKQITLHVDLLPIANHIQIEVCDDDLEDEVSDGQIEFNLTDYISLITDGATGVTVEFYETAAAAEAGLGNAGADFIDTPEAYINILDNPQAIFARVFSPISECSAIAIVNLHVNPNPTPLNNDEIEDTLGNEGVMLECDGNVDGSGAISEQVAEFDLTQWELAILNGEDGVSAAYYTSIDDAEAGANAIANPAAYTNIVNPQTIYVSVINDGFGIAPITNGTGCYTIVEFQLFVPVPEVSVLADKEVICIDVNGVPLTDTTLPLLTATAGPQNLDLYDYQWSLDGVAIAGATNNTLEATVPGEYTVTVSGPTDFDCINVSQPVTIGVSGIPADFNASVTTVAFADSHQVVAVAASNIPGIVFWYSLDDGTPTLDGTFDNVSPGSHQVTITDGEGCWTYTDTVILIDYPHFFTPNGDGINDTWAIIGQEGIPISQIYIFDRFGKLLSQLDPDGAGWDGTYNGNQMPGSDYWFKIIYIEGTDSTQKEFKAHFSLKR